MNKPGFTAEASLYRMNRYCEIARIGATSIAEVVPTAQSLCCEDCYAEADAACSGDPYPVSQSYCYEYYDYKCRNCELCPLLE